MELSDRSSIAVPGANGHEAQSDDDFSNLPPPEVLPVSEMLDTFEKVNVLAPLVRCSKLPFRHLCSMYETHVTHTPMILAQEFSRSQNARMSDFTTSSDERGVFWMEPRKSTSATTSAGRIVVHPEDVLTTNGLALNTADAGSSITSRPTPKTHYTSRPTARLPSTSRPPTKHSRLVRGALVAQFASPNSEHLADAAELIAKHVDGLDINCGCPQSWAYKEGVGCALLRKPELVRDMIRTVKGRLGWGWPVSIKIRVDPDLRCARPPTPPSGPS